tara:strand:- start:6794 stop:7018 length:225 start_codon:yes stop_codon:yes gene_type:complete
MKPKMDKINVLEIETISPNGTVWERRLARLHDQLSEAETEWAQKYLAELLLTCLKLASRQTDPNENLHRSHTIH